MAQLKTGRLAANDLLSTYPNGQGGLEQDLCAIFGFTQNTDITASPFSLDNSGRITKGLLQQASTEIPKQSQGIGLQLNDTGSGKSVMVGQNTSNGGQLFTVMTGGQNLSVPGGPLIGASAPLFSVDMTNGTLSGYTAQDMSSTPLVLATGGVGNTYYYNALGQWSIPGSLPFTGCKLQATVLTQDGGGTAFQTWSSVSGVNVFDVGGHYDGTNKITSGAAGKYLVVVNLPMYSVSNNGLNGQMVLIDDGSNIIAKNRIDTIRNNYYLSFSTVWNASSSSSWLKLQITNNMASGSFIASGDDNGIISSTKLFKGSFSFFRIE
jgi:hypothetical protein